MNNVTAPGNAKEISVSAVVIRKDGTVEDLGRIAYWHKNPIRRLIARLTNRKR